MQYAGVLPEDAPDPAIARIELLRLMPIPIYGFAPQPHLEDTDSFSISHGMGGHGLEDMSVAISYTLWRRPEARADPINLAVLDDDTRGALEQVPPWPRPAWLIAAAERMRYPQLRDAVRTAWHRPDPTVRRFSLDEELVQHVNSILANRRERVMDGGGPVPPVGDRSIERGIPVTVDGVERLGIRIDTDPHVFGLGADLGVDGILTAVLERDALPAVVLSFQTRPIPSLPIRSAA